MNDERGQDEGDAECENDFVGAIHLFQAVDGGLKSVFGSVSERRRNKGGHVFSAFVIVSLAFEPVEYRGFDFGAGSRARILVLVAEI
jgi:hypothetical protein